MTIADHIREEVTFNVIENLVKKGVDDKFIADVIKLPLKKCKTTSKKLRTLLINLSSS
jgi:chorismate mutase